MTVLSTTNKMAPQAMNGAATNFAFTFRALVDFPDAIKAVILNTTTDVETELVKDAGAPDGYTVAVDADGLGGSITVDDARSADYEITIYREYNETQESNYADYNAFPAETVENNLDKLTMITQQNTEELSRAITLPITVTGVSTELPIPLADATIGWNATADALVNNPAGVYTVQVDAAATADYIGATSSDGVLRTTAPITYADGGNFVTLGIDIPALLGAGDFTDLGDTPASYAGQALRGLRVNAGATALEFVTLTTGADFISLTDTPGTYVGAGLQSVRVNAGATALEFYTPSTTTDFVSLTDTPANYAGSGGFLVRVNATPDGLEFSNETSINHNTLTNYVGNEHVDHSAVSVTAGSGLSGGGNIVTTKTINVDINPETLVTAAAGDELLIADVSDSNNIKKVTAQTIADLASGGGSLNATRTLDWELLVHNGIPAAGVLGAAAHNRILGSEMYTEGQITKDNGEGIIWAGDGTNVAKFWLLDGTGIATTDGYFPFTLATGKKVYIRLVVQWTGTLSTAVIGLASDATTQVPNLATPDDGVFWKIGASSFNMTSSAGGTRTDTNEGTSDTTEKDLYMVLDPGVSLAYEINGVPSTTKTVNIPGNGVLLTPFYFGASNAGRGFRIKHFKVSQEK